MFDSTEYFHRRINPLTGKSVLVSPHRTSSMLGGPQRDLTAEQAAQRLRELPQTHYKAC